MRSAAAISDRTGRCEQMVQECLNGGNLNVPSDGLLLALDTPEDAKAFGTAVAQMHSADRAWFDARVPGDPLDAALREKFAGSKHGAASKCNCIACHPFLLVTCRCWCQPCLSAVGCRC